MVQWFKKVWTRLTGKTEASRVLSFNKVRLQSEIQNLSDKLYEFRGEISWQIVREAIELARNIQILEVNGYRTQEDLWIHRGRLQALSDLGSYVDRAILSRAEEAKTGRKQDVRGSLRTAHPRTTSNQATAAI